jgi:hypothetical protein
MHARELKTFAFDSQGAPLLMNDKENLYTVEFYSPTRRNEILSFAGKWMELENIILS